jgi:hypothetical protein
MVLSGLVLVALICVLYVGFLAGGWTVPLIIAAVCLVVALLLGFYPVGPAWGHRA